MALEWWIPCSYAYIQPPSLLSWYHFVNEYALVAERDGQLKTSSATGILMGSIHTRHKYCHMIGLLFLQPCYESFNLATFNFLTTDHSYHPQIRSGPYSVSSRGSCDDVLLEVFTLGGFPIPTILQRTPELLRGASSSFGCCVLFRAIWTGLQGFPQLVTGRAEGGSVGGWVTTY